APYLTALYALSLHDALPIFDAALVAHDQPVGAGPPVVPGEDHVLADEARLDARADPLDPRARADDRVLELGVADRDLVADRRERADVGALHQGVAPDDGGPEHRGPLDHGAGLDDDLADELAVLDGPLDAPAQPAEHEAVGVEDVLGLAGVLPPARHDPRRHRLAGLDHPLDRVGDLVLALGAGLQALDRIVDRGVEDVDPGHGQVAGRVGRLLDEALDAPVLDHGDPELARVRHLDERQH